MKMADDDICISLEHAYQHYLAFSGTVSPRGPSSTWSFHPTDLMDLVSLLMNICILGSYQYFKISNPLT